MKKYLSLLFAVVVFVGLLSGCSGDSVINVSSNKATSEQIRIGMNNLRNGGEVATDGEYVYVAKSGDGARIYKISMSDFSVVSVFHGEAYGLERSILDMYCIGDTLYYYTSYNDGCHAIYNVGSDHPEYHYMEMIGSISPVISDGEYHYVRLDIPSGKDPGIYRVKASDFKKDPQNAEFTKLYDLMVGSFFLHSDYLYVVARTGKIDGIPNSGYGIWRMDLDGKNLIHIYDFCVDKILFCGDRMYFSDEDGELLYSANLDGSDLKCYEDAWPMDYTTANFNITDDYIFFRSGRDIKIHRMNHDGTNNVLINDVYSFGVYICGDWVIYKNDDDDQFYKMRFDGSENSLLFEAASGW